MSSASGRWRRRIPTSWRWSIPVGGRGRPASCWHRATSWCTGCAPSACSRATRSPSCCRTASTGTTGRPKGVRRPLPGADPETSAIGFGGMLLLFGLQPHDDNVHLCGSPLYHTAVLVFSGGALHLGHTVVLMDKWTPEGTLELI